MILIDSNVPMYLVGAEHPNKARSRSLLETAVSARERLVTDAEVLQEILHRYSALKLWKVGRRLYDHTRIVLPRVVPITGEVMDLARSLMDDVPHLMARDALHAAVAITTGATAFCSYDRDFDRIAGIRRVEPPDVR